MKCPVEKNKEYEVEIIDNGFEGEGIAKIEDFTIFIPNAIKGEKVRILIVKVLSSYAFGKIVEIIKKSQARMEPDCDTYKRCGGCNLRHIKYEETLKIKQDMVQNLVNKSLKQKLEVEEVLGMQNPYNYRNKAQYPIGLNKDGKPVLGVFANRTHEIIPINNCFIQNKKTEQIAKFIFDFFVKNNISVYNEKTGKGLIRHIVTKIGIRTNEIMCIIVVNGREFPKEKELVSAVTSNFPEVKTIVKNVNVKNTNVIFGLENINLFGDGFITDKLGDYIFKISPLSFYQVNPIQAEKLYNIAVEELKKQNVDIIFDLYCGIGTISIFLSKYANRVFGIEIVDEAIKMANENASLNGIDNIDFFAGDAQVIFDDLINEKNIIPDAVLVDPPRKGLDVNTIQNLLSIKPKKIIYISCNPATLVRDLSLLEDFYCISRIKPVDLFCFTSHVECVTVLNLK